MSADNHVNDNVKREPAFQEDRLSFY